MTRYGLPNVSQPLNYLVTERDRYDAKPWEILIKDVKIERKKAASR